MSAADDRAAADSAERVAIVGAGRAGRAIAAALLASDAREARLVVLHGRASQSASDGPPPAVTAGPLPTAALGATIVLVTVPDAQLDALDALAGDDVARRAYAALTAAAVDMLRAGGREVPRLVEVRRLAGERP